MLVQHRTILMQVLKAVDAAIVSLSLCLATLLAVQQAQNISWYEFLSMRFKLQNFLLVFSFLVIWYITFSISRLYDGRRLATLASEARDIVKATSVGTCILLLMSVVFNVRIYTLNFIGAFWLCSTGLTLLSRVVLQFGLNNLRLHGRNIRYMLIVGTNRRALDFARSIAARRDLGYRILGFVDNAWEGAREAGRSGFNVLADLAGFRQVLSSNVVDEVVVLLPVKSFYSEVEDIVAQCREQGITMRFVPRLFDLELAQSRIDLFEGESVITLHARNRDDWQMFLKRSFDCGVALALLTLFAPVFLLVMACLKITNGGPIFFVQRRVGLNKRLFSMYKFRTMVMDAEEMLDDLEHLNEASGPVFKINNDPRVTPIGRILRRTSLDELPQLFNVLTGDMSLVGPRPLPMRDYNGFSVDWHRRRFSVRPGITCLWQAGGRHEIPFEKWMELDMLYIDNWSFWLDLTILAKTCSSILRCNGAA